MNKAKLIEGLELVLEALKEETTTEVHVVTEKKPSKTADAPAAKTEATKDETPAGNDGTSAADIDDMPYNDLKKFAQSIGIKAVGTADQIRAKVKKALAGGEDDAAEEEPVKKAPVAKANVAKAPAKNDKVVPITKGKKAVGLKSKAKEPEMDELEKQVREEAEDMSVEDISELLLSVKVKQTGDREALLKALVKAVRDGKISLDEEDEADVDDGAEESSGQDGEETDFTQYHAEYDPDGLNDPDTMTDARKAAVEKMISHELSSIESGDISEKDVHDFLETLLTEEQSEKYNVGGLDSDELLFLYLEVNKALIDDDGDVHEPNDPYVINDTNVCCGHALKYDEENDQYICEACGQTYEA